MASRKLDLTGNRFGRLVAIECAGPARRSYKWRCRCDCGNEIAVVVANLRNGHTRSCGCLALDGRFKHGMKDTPLHRRWIGFRARCRNSNDPRWMDYGGRGITYAPEWDDFTEFADWATSNGFSPELQLDRIDNDGPYAPWNCRWVDRETNANNRRDNQVFEFFGQRLSISQAARKFSIPDSTLQARLVSYGMTPADAVTVPVTPGALRRITNARRRAARATRKAIPHADI